MNVSVAGCTARSGILTWAQQDIIDYVRRDPYLQAIVDTPHRPRLDDFLEAIRTVVRRHESLRTLFVEENGVPARQDVQDDVNVPVLVMSAPASDGDGEVLVSALRHRPINTAKELSYRIGLLLDDGTVRRVAVVVSHLMVDGWGFENLLTELLKETRAVGHGQPTPREVFQQLDQVEWESGKSGERRKDLALAHHRSDALLLETLRPSWGKPARPVESVHLGGMSLGLGSAQLEATARRLSVGVPSLLLAAYTTAVSAALDIGAFLVMLHCANRFSPSRMRSVSRLKTTTTMPVTEADGTLHEVAAATRELSLMAYQHSQYPPGEHAQMMDEVLPGRQEGAPLIVEFNDRRAIFDPAVGTSPGAGVDLTPFPDDPVVSPKPIRRASQPVLCLAIDPCLRTGGAALKVETNLLSRDMIGDFLSGIRDHLDREFRTSR
ncbi:condensation domain-containing protein [Streptomyces sp. NPDC005492]|uniref:condensation domain-containing protein n=1 Tax=Streptomyces sp. NPDC005492 TaxID=3156883 RepID=UPI0033B70C0C